MACFALPKKFCDKLNSYISNFWWSNNSDTRGIHWANWDRATQSKLSGGLGFRDFKAFNIAMLAKQGWRLTINPNSFWGRVMKGIYYPNSDFLHAAKGRRPSWAWSSLLQGREILLKGTVGKWQTDPRFSSGVISGFHHQRISRYILLDHRTARFYLWKISLISDRNLGKKAKSASGSLKRKLSQFLVFPSLIIIRWIFWFGTMNLRAISLLKLATIWLESVNRKQIDPKLLPLSSPLKPFGNLSGALISLQSWNISGGKRAAISLQQRRISHRRKCHPSPICPICQKEPESIEHLLFRCEWTSAAWFGSCLNYKVDSCAIPSVMKWTVSLMESLNSAS